MTRTYDLRALEAACALLAADSELGKYETASCIVRTLDPTVRLADVAGLWIGGTERVDVVLGLDRGPPDWDWLRDLARAALRAAFGDRELEIDRLGAVSGGRVSGTMHADGYRWRNP